MLKGYWVNHGSEQSDLTCELKADGSVSLDNGEETFFLSKDKDGKLVLDKLLNGDNVFTSKAVIYPIEDALRFSDKMYQENESSYIGFSNRQWGWSNTVDSIQYTSDYQLNEGYQHWTSTNAAGTTYLGINIPAGVRWGEHIGPLMLVDRVGFTQPSIYKPL